MVAILVISAKALGRGFTRPRSHRDTVDISTLKRSANSLWVSPSSRRARLTRNADLFRNANLVLCSLYANGRGPGPSRWGPWRTREDDGGLRGEEWTGCPTNSRGQGSPCHSSLLLGARLGLLHGVPPWYSAASPLRGGACFCLSHHRPPATARSRLHFHKTNARRLIATALTCEEAVNCTLRVT